MPKVNKINEFVSPEDNDEELWDFMDDVFNDMDDAVTDEGEKAEPGATPIIYLRDGPLHELAKDLREMEAIMEGLRGKPAPTVESRDTTGMDPWLRAWLGQHVPDLVMCGSGECFITGEPGPFPSGAVRSDNINDYSGHDDEGFPGC